MPQYHFQKRTITTRPENGKVICKIPPDQYREYSDFQDFINRGLKNVLEIVEVDTSDPVAATALIDRLGHNLIFRNKVGSANRIYLSYKSNNSNRNKTVFNLKGRDTYHVSEMDEDLILLCYCDRLPDERFLEDGFHTYHTLEVDEDDDYDYDYYDDTIGTMLAYYLPDREEYVEKCSDYAVLIRLI